MPHAYVALLLIHLHFPDAESLKEKRKELSSVKAQLRTRLGVAVAEVDGQDTWQRATLAAALTSGSFKQLDAGRRPRRGLAAEPLSGGRARRAQPDLVR